MITLGVGTMLQIQMQALKYSDDESFKALTGWTQRFMKRHRLGFHTKTKISQKLPDVFEGKIISFHKFVMNLRNTRLTSNKLATWMKYQCALTCLQIKQ